MELSLEEVLSKIVAYSYKKGYSFVFYRLPDSQLVEISLTKHVVPVDLEFIKDGKTGFVFAPFQESIKVPRLFFPIENVIRWNLEKSKMLVCQVSPEIFSTEEKPQFYTKSKNVSDTSENDFKNQVEDAISIIKNQVVKKIVLSKVKTSRFDSAEKTIQFFLDILSDRTNAFVSLVSSPACGTWIGATPEVLLTQTKNTFQTVALAGTQSANGVKLSDAVWRQKEIEEQAFVSRYIIDCFKYIRLREFEEFGPKTVKAGNLLHLKTEFTVDTKEVDFPELATSMLGLLHPTSAVCGMPKKESLDYILAKEKHERKYYSGYLGPVNRFLETQLFVNLRCVELTENQLLFYAGAGITEDSDPQKEWLETEMKCESLMNYLN